MREGFVWMNGEIIPLEEARVSVLDYGFLYGFGLFETLRAYGGRPFMLEEHLERLNGALEELGMNLQLKADEVRDALQELLLRNELRAVDSRIRITVTPGEGRPIGDPDTCKAPTIVIFASPIPPDLDERLASGVSATIYPYPRSVSGRMSRMKLISYVENLLARRYARRRDAFESLFLDGSGRLLEGATSNLFVVKGGGLATPPVELGLLPGVTRALVIRIASDIGVEVEEGELILDDLLSSDGAFITNSIIEVTPLAEIEGRRIPQSEIISRLREAYRRMRGE
jgi:branched-subunit amino acid aminotransferase/4-amino-4-deoxychorismate lyase